MAEEQIEEQPSLSPATGLWDIAGFVSFATLFVYYAYYLTGVFFLEISKAPEASTSDIGVVASAISFASGFLLRPIGGIYYGAISDTVGRKVAFVRSLKLLSIVSFCFVIIDTSILGTTVSVVAVTLMRLVQGFFMGGASTAGIIYLYDLSPENHKGKFTSLLQMSVPAGYVTCIALVLVAKLVFSVDDQGVWGWRFAYSLCAFLYPLAKYIERNLPEVNAQPNQKWNLPILKNHLHSFFGDNAMMKKVLFFPMLITISAGVLFFFYTIYRGYFLGPVLKISTDDTSFILGISSALVLPFFPIFGALSDRFGRLKFVYAGIFLGALFFIPFWKGLESAPMTAGSIKGQYVNFIAFISVVGILMTLAQANLAALLCDWMPDRFRGLGFGFIYNFGLILMGALLQNVATYYYETDGDLYRGLYITLGVVTVAGLVSLFAKKK